MMDTQKLALRLCGWQAALGGRPSRRMTQHPTEAGLVAFSLENQQVITYVLSFLSLHLFGLEENFANKLKM